MRRAAVAIVTTTLGLVLLLSFKTHQPASTATERPGASAQPTPPASGSAGGTAGTGGASPSAGSASGTQVVTGDAVDTRYGPVQVRVTLSGGRITQIDVVQAPTDTPRDIEINNYALPILTQEALAAQSASIDTVSGATYTTEGYVGSLQSALDQAQR
jgi:uncharacterized protein with FMN-binding domain